MTDFYPRGKGHMHRIFTALVGCVAVGFAALPSQAAFTINDLYNTGQATQSTLQPQGSADPHYSVTKPDNTTAPGLVTVDDAFPIPPWIANDGNSQWVSPSLADNDAAGNYRWSTTFTLPANVLLDSIAIIGRWATDNQGLDILINGNSTGGAFATPATNSSFTSYTPFSILSSTYNFFQPGVNTLTFIVNNAAGSTGNPSGLRVDDIRGTYATPEPTTLVTWGLLLGASAVVYCRKK